MSPALVSISRWLHHPLSPRSLHKWHRRSHPHVRPHPDLRHVVPSPGEDESHQHQSNVQRCRRRSLIFPWNVDLQVRNWNIQNKIFWSDLSHTDSDTAGDNVTVLLSVYSGVSVLLLVLVLAYFPSKPCLPPSNSAQEERMDFWQGVRSVLSSR